MSTNGVNGTHDFLDACLTVEEDSIEAGRRQGFQDGQAKGIQEGLDFGIRKGFELGSELGFYVGLVEVWRVLAESQPRLISDRTLRAVDALHQQLEALSAQPAVPSLQAAMPQIRGRAKVIAASLGVLQLYFPATPPSASIDV